MLSIKGLSSVDCTPGSLNQQTMTKYFEKKQRQTQQSPGGGDIGNITRSLTAYDKHSNADGRDIEAEESSIRTGIATRPLTGDFVRRIIVA